MIIEGRLCGAYCVVVKLSLCCRELPVWVWEISSSSLDSSDEWGEKTMTWHHRSLQRSPDYPLVLLTARVRLQSESDHHHLLFSPQMENWGGPSCICPPPHLTTPAQTRILTEVRLFTTDCWYWYDYQIICTGQRGTRRISKMVSFSPNLPHRICSLRLQHRSL